MNNQWGQPLRWLSALACITLLLGGCIAPTTTPSASSQIPESPTEATTETTQATTLPDLSPVDLAGGKLRVVATTNLVGDVVAQIGGDYIELATLFAPGVDPHAYQLTPSDRRLLENAQVIFVNGLGLEEAMLPILDELDNNVPVVAVSTGIATLEFGEHESEHEEEHAHEGEEHEGEEHEGEEHEGEEHEGEEGDHHHEGADPHVWHSVPNVLVWTDNVATALSALDPAQADAYNAAAADYRTELEALNIELHALVETLPADQRKLVTDHDSLGYLEEEYGFTVVGTVIPSLSTLASTSAQELAALQEQITIEGITAIFVGSTVSPALANQLATDLDIRVVPIYSDSLSDVTGPASNYVDFMRHNLQTIVAALQ